MRRAIYVILLRLHPPAFRRQFAAEMLWIFDQTSTTRTSALFADAFRSLVVQWMFRGELDEQAGLAGIPGPAVDRVPVFYTSGSDIPPPSALFNGLILSVGVFALASFALAHSGGHARVFTYYGNEFHAGPPAYGEPSGPPLGGQPAQPGRASSEVWARLTSLFRRSSPRSADITADVPRIAEMAPGPDSGSNPRFNLILMNRTRSAVYFKSVPVLAALDTNHDGELSPDEIANAPAALAVLDRNHDGKLDAEECGYHPHILNPPSATPRSAAPKPEAPPKPDPKDPIDRRARTDFMRLEPVLAALDADHDNVISPDEIRNAPAALKTLDRNHDGHLTLAEVVPDPASREVAAIFRLDVDFDGKISTAERRNPFGRDVGVLLDAADRHGNHDGYVTWEELAAEIHRRADLNHDGVVTWEELMKARAAGALNGRPRQALLIPHSETR